MAGATTQVTSDVYFYVLNSNGQVVAESQNNNVATQAPWQGLTVPSSGNYYLAVQVASGTAPGHVEIIGVNDTNAALAISQEYGSAGGTYYPSSFGHSAAAAAIGVAATPWWAPSPFIGQNPLATEPFSSPGPADIDLSPKGTPIAPDLVQNPAITAPEGANTSFFIPGFKLNTANPPFFGEPASSTNLVPEGQQNLNVFFGTSSAAPDAAAVAVLMLQADPSLSRAQILKALTSTALPMNNTPSGTWNPQSGYGLVNAVAAIESVAPPTGAATTITVGTSVASPTLGVSVTLTATVAGSHGTPTGTVDFYDVTSNTDLGSANLAGGVASLTFTTTVLGSHVFLETYSGNSTYAKSTAYLLQIVGSATAAAVVAVPDADSVSAVSVSNQVAVDLSASVAVSTTTKAKKVAS